jgi:hypothetical protein
MQKFNETHVRQKHNAMKSKQMLSNQGSFRKTFINKKTNLNLPTWQVGKFHCFSDRDALSNKQSNREFSPPMSPTSVGQQRMSINEMNKAFISPR